MENENITQPPTPTPVVQPTLPASSISSNTSKRLIILVVLFIIAVAGIATYVIALKYAPLPPNYLPQPTPLAVTQPTPTPDPTANWKTYTDTKYGFSLKYPNGWDFKPCSDVLCGTFTENNKEIVKLEGVSDACGLGAFTPTPEYAEKFSMCMCDASGPGINLNCESPKEEKTITNQFGIKYYSFVLNELKNNQFNGVRGPYNTIFFSKPILSRGTLNEYGLYFEVLDNNKIPELDQILSTFKFN